MFGVGDPIGSPTVPAALIAEREASHVDDLEAVYPSAEQESLFTHLRKKDGNARERLTVMSELPGENGEKLVENGAGKGERILAVDDLSEHLVTSSAWQRKSRYQHVRVEYDPYARGYRRRSSSVRIPSSFALRLQ